MVTAGEGDGERVGSEDDDVDDGVGWDLRDGSDTDTAAEGTRRT